MALDDRQELIGEIEEIRGSKVLTYIVSTREGITTQMELQDLRYIREVLGEATETHDQIDVFIYSWGGEIQVSWVLANLLNEYADGYNVLIPYSSLSCATSVALGAEEVVMGRMGQLGPVDPLVANEFNPREEGRALHISVEDVSNYQSLIKEMFEITDEENVTSAISSLIDKVHPLALGNAYRHWLKARDDTRKLLELHMDPKRDKDAIDQIVDTLVERLYFHGHRINRAEGAEIGLNVKVAEAVDPELEGLMWSLYTQYEEDMDLDVPYRDTPPDGGERTLPLKMVETTDQSYCFKLSQEWRNVANTVPGTPVLTQDGKVAVFDNQGQLVQIQVEGNPLVANGVVYDKVEYPQWDKLQ